MKPRNVLLSRGAVGSAVRLRNQRNQNQTEFWSKFGVSQACASRFECTFNVPGPVLLLLNLYLDGVISDLDLNRHLRHWNTDE